ncbi:MAG: AsmA family protein [Magnetococcales bacterium]|nr:AsmA family protein [Magnetococcales bacterium]
MRDSGTLIIKWTMVLIYSALSMIVLSFLLAMVLPLLTNPNHYKSRIESMVQEKSGRILTLAGDVEWEFFPNPTITFKDLALSNAVGFRPEPMLQMRRLQGRMAWQNIWRGQWVLEQPLVTGLALRLEVDGAGRNNWDDLMRRLFTETETEAAVKGSPSEGGRVDSVAKEENNALLRLGTQVLAGLLSRAVTIRDGSVHYCRAEERASPCTVVTHLDYSPKAETTGTVQMQGDVTLLTPALSGRVKLSYQPVAQSGSGVMAWRNLELSLRGRVEHASAKEVELFWHSDVTVAADWQRIDLHQADSRFTVWSDAALFREMGFSLRGTALADLQAGTLHFPQGGVQWRIKSDQLPPAGVEFALQSALAVDWRQGKVEMEAMQILAPAQSRMEGRLRGVNLLSHPQVDAELTSFRFDPRALLVALGRPVPAIADPSAMRSGSGSAKMQWGDQQLSISDLQLEMDGSRWEGSLSWQRGSAPDPVDQVRFVLHGDRLELDRYLPPEWVGPQQVALVTRTLLAPEWLLLEMPTRGLPQIHVQGRLALDALQSAAGRGTDMVMELAIQDHQLELQPYRITIHDGVLESRVTWNERGVEPAWQVEKQGNDLQVEPLLRLFNDSHWLTGRASGTIRLSSFGRQAEGWWSNLQGSCSVTIQDGSVQGMDLTERLRDNVRPPREAWTASTTNEKSSGERRTNTPFHQLSGSGRIAAGMLENTDLQISAPAMQASGRGSVDLLRHTVDYTLEVEGSGSPRPGMVGGQRMLLPIRLQGELHNWKGPTIGTVRALPATPPP